MRINSYFSFDDRQSIHALNVYHHPTAVNGVGDGVAVETVDIRRREVAERPDAASHAGYQLQAHVHPHW